MASGTLVDANVILDIATDDPAWADWPADALAQAAELGPLLINPLIYAEVSIGCSRIEDLEDVLAPSEFRRIPLPYEAAFLAGKAFMAYRRRGGTRRSPLPDFSIGAHAAVGNVTLLTRDSRRYRTYFPHVTVIAPNS